MNTLITQFKTSLTMSLLAFIFACTTEDSGKNYTKEEVSQMRSVGLDPVKDYQILKLYNKLDNIPENTAFIIKKDSLTGEYEIIINE